MSESSLIRVGVAGALGRMGRVACVAIETAADMQLAAGFARRGSGDRIAEHVPGITSEGRLYGDLGEFLGAGLDVVLDLTTYPISLDIAREAVMAGISPVIGATGWPDEDVISFEDECDEQAVGAMLVPNFALGAVLMMKFAEEVAKVFPNVEIIEMHHDQKRDKPSGTAGLTARRIEAARGGRAKVPIHSVRLPGLVAHQEVIFGGTGETLTLRHDSLARESFASGMLLAIRRVRGLKDLEIGLDAAVAGGAA
ncbi:MAG TPA: 4-hydroxy-tetrahydrodipicolinate reductase [Candidatus Acidoferrales bacterium]|nr:4-hydroxy-tetrahydrodipicolinate reductase [Candidatus Acidoferrales bacterium]